MEQAYGDYSRKISERQWNQPNKGELESRREATFMDDIIQKAHIERRLLENLDGIETVFDGGAGCGRFSILLAKQGLKVTHFDISEPMIEKARELAAGAGVLDRITFVRGALEDLGAFPDRAFDLVLSVDAPVSYTYPNQDRVVGELVRLARKRILLSVSSRLGSLPYLATPIPKNQFILDENDADPFVRWCVENNIPVAPGCVTPTEIMGALKHGLKMVKFFPANVYGGLNAMKNLSAPFVGLKFLPTGGVNTANITEYIDAPFIHAVGGSWVCPKADIAAGNWEKITNLCIEARKNAKGE